MQYLSTRRWRRMWAAIGLVLAASVFIATIAEAQVLKGQIILGPTISDPMPLGDLDTHADPGIGAGGTIDVMLRDNCAVGGEITYQSFSGSGNGSPAESPQVLLASVHGKIFLNPYSPNNLALIGGVGPYLSTHTHTSKAGGGWQVNLGANIGGGVMIRLGKSLKASVVGRFHSIFTGSKPIQLATITGALLFVLGPTE